MLGNHFLHSTFKMSLSFMNKKNVKLPSVDKENWEKNTISIKICS